MENSRARQESLFRSLSSGLIAIDNAGLVTHWNPAAADMMGVRPDVALGARLTEILPAGLASWIGNLAIQAELDVKQGLMDDQLALELYVQAMASPPKRTPAAAHR